MSLDQEIAAFLAEAETRPAASKLEPYTELIRTLRQRRWTFVEIATTLREKFGLPVAPSTIHAFVKVRAKRKSVSAPAAPDTLPANPAIPAAPTKKPRFHLDA